MRVLIRIDFNGEYRIKRHLKTIKKYKGHRVMVCGHYGRPQGRDPKFSLEQFRKLLPVDIELLENLRFDKREYDNDESLAKELASKCDLYVQDAFSACHRKHASIIGVPKFVDSVSGLVLKKEIKVLKKDFARPLIFIVGGGKIKTKVPLVEKLLPKADHILLGGLIANMILRDGGILSTKLHLPVDAITGYGERAVGRVKDKMDILDIGFDTRSLFKDILQSAKTIVWNGPMGKFEDESYDDGSVFMAQEISRLSAYKIVGGGDLVSLIGELKLNDKFNYISTGGGAMLEFLAEGTLPGIEALRIRSNHEELAS